MKRSAIVTASSIILIGLAFAGHVTGVATAKLAHTGPASLQAEFRPVFIDKSARLNPYEDALAADGDVTVEWVIDCYDQFGPDGAKPDAANLDGCMPT